MLDLLAYSVGYGNGQHREQAGGENNKLLDGSGNPMDSAKIDNRRWLRSMLSTDGKITVTATHAGTGQKTSVELEYSKVTDEFYMFQFFPKAKTSVTYYNGTGEKITVDSGSSRASLPCWSRRAST